VRKVFADTHYWIALTDPADPWHLHARAAKERLGPLPLVTTDEVLVEFLSAYCARGWHYREMACQLIHCLRREPNVTVVEQSRTSFDGGLILYYARHDKAYSLVDCISMNTMHQMEIADVLTHDRHFAQEGFRVLLS
jgi:uncharacterized protein